MTTSKILSNILLKNQELSIATITNPMNTYTLVGNILQRDLQIRPGEAFIWSRLDALVKLVIG